MEVTIARRSPGILVKVQHLTLLPLLLRLVRLTPVTPRHMAVPLQTRDIAHGRHNLALQAITRLLVCTFPSARGQALNRPLDRPPPATVQTYNSPDGAHLSWQYSQCTGTKKALLIGINYFHQTGELKGCINDALHVRKFLIGKSSQSSVTTVLTVCQARFGYQPGDILVLTDDTKDARHMPTRDNIVSLKRLIPETAQTYTDSASGDAVARCWRETQ